MDTSAKRYHREALLMAGLSRKLWGHGPLKPSIVFFKQKEHLQSNITVNSKITNSASWSFLLLCGWKPQVSSTSGIPWKMCLYCLWQGTKRPFWTGCWLTSAKTHWLHKENGFHFVWWRLRRPSVHGWLGKKKKKKISYPGWWEKTFLSLDYWGYGYQTSEEIISVTQRSASGQREEIRGCGHVDILCLL